MGGLLVAPPLMSWSGYRRHALPSPARLVELGALVLALASAGMVAYFASVRGDVHSPLEYLPFPVAIWVAMRFGVRGATAATLVVSGVALAGHVLLEPPGTAAPTERETLLIQASLAVGALTSLLVGAVTTERNETMRALGESEQRATALFAQAPDAIFMLEGEPPHVGKVLAANPAAGDMHGVAPEALAGRHLADFQRAGQRDALQQALEAAPEDDRVRIEMAHARDDGEVVDIEMHAQAFRVRGHRYLLAFDRDITERAPQRGREGGDGREAARDAEAREPGRARRRHRARLQQPADRHPRPRQPGPAVHRAERDRRLPRAGRAVDRARRRAVRPDARLRRQGPLRDRARRSRAPRCTRPRR